MNVDESNKYQFDNNDFNKNKLAAFDDVLENGLALYGRIIVDLKIIFLELFKVSPIYKSQKFKKISKSAKGINIENNINIFFSFF